MRPVEFGAKSRSPFVAAGAQQPVKLHRIGILSIGSASEPIPSIEAFEAFQQGLRESGWIEGHNIAIEYRSQRGRILDTAAEGRLPAMYGTRAWA